MKLSTYIALCFGLILTWGCEEIQEFEIEANDAQLLVVEAIITNENKQHEVKLSRTFGDLSNPAPLVSNAIVALNDGDTTMLLTEDPNQPGVYLTDSLRALFGKGYILYIKVENQEYFAVSSAAIGIPLEPLELLTLEDGTLEYVYEESTTPSMMEINVSWEELDDSNQLIPKKIQAFFYSLDVIDVNKIFAPDKERITFPKGATFSRRKFGLTQDHQEFLRSLLSEIDWRGGTFDVAPGNVKTNLSDGAVGFFAVSMVQTDQAIVD